MIIVLGISEQEDFHRPEIPLEKTREIDNEARTSKKTGIKEAHNSVRHPPKLSNILDLTNHLKSNCHLENQKWFLELPKECHLALDLKTQFHVLYSHV